MDPSRPCREALDIVPVSVTVRREILKTEASYGGVGNSPEAIDGCTAGRCRLSGTQARPGMFAWSFPNLRRRSKGCFETRYKARQALLHWRRLFNGIVMCTDKPC